MYLGPLGLGPTVELNDIGPTGGPYGSDVLVPRRCGDLETWVVWCGDISRLECILCAGIGDVTT